MEDIYHLGVKALIRNSNGEILLLKVNPEKLKSTAGESYWDIPGGRVQKDQNIYNTLIREINEETGVTQVTDIKPITIVLSNIRIPLKEGSAGLILSIYECVIPSETKILLSDEHIEYCWSQPRKAAEYLSIKYPSEFTDLLNNL